MKRNLIIEVVCYVVIAACIALIVSSCVCGCAAQTETTGIDEQPRVTNQTNVPTTQASTAGRDSTVKGPETKTSTMIGVPWYGMAIMAAVSVAGLTVLLYGMHKWGYHAGTWRKKESFRLKNGI